MADNSIILVGAGNMGGAMMAGWLDNGMPASQICVLDPNPNPSVSALIKDRGIQYAKEGTNLAPPGTLLIAVKPQVMGDVLAPLKHLVGENTVVISVAAGKNTSFIENHLGKSAVIRCMPNTPALVKKGISVLFANERTSEMQKEITGQLLEAVGSVEWVEDEDLMDAVTAVSGSGPAYAFHLVEALGSAAIKAGLPEVLARKLALETVAGAGALMMGSDLSPGQLRENVTSPGGTTQAALDVLMGEGGFPSLLEKAVEAAKARSKELS